MLNQPEPACLVIADISGYTSYVAGVELDHAQDILADLMDTVVGSLRPKFRLAKLEGDAAFVFMLAETLDGSALQDTIERTYFSFRRRVRDINQASQCDCNACMRIPNLDLKVVVHHGVVARHRIAGRDELAGSAVILVHRLLKNRVDEATGIKVYALYTQACLDVAGIDPDAQGLRRHVESTDIAGDVTVWLRDLEAAWVAEQAATRVVVKPADALATFEAFYPGPPEIVWEWVTSPARRPQWQAGVTGVTEEAAGGRRGQGTVNHCIHGRDAVVEEVLDWRPFEYLTLRVQLPIPGSPKLIMTDTFEPVDDGTRHASRVARPRARKDVEFIASLGPMFEEVMSEAAITLGRLIAEDVARRVAEGTLEPPTPVSKARYLSAPLTVDVDPELARSS